MQVKVYCFTKRYETFPSDKHLIAVKKLRKAFNISEFKSVSLRSNFVTLLPNVINDCIFLVDESDYASVLKTFKSNNFNAVVIKYGNEIDDIIEKNSDITDNFTTYKLFNTSTVVLDNFLVKFNFNYKIENTDGDIKVSVDLSNATNEEKDTFVKAFLTEFNGKIYSYYDVLPEKLLVDILSVRNMKISVAESFTGGNISALITSVSGSSKVFYEGVVSYNENSKANRLNVSNDSLLKYKPVSKQVAYEMCKGLLDSGNCDIAISTTGIAGPNSDDSNFPVGLCFIAVGTQEKITVYKFNFKGSRSDITAQGVKMAICLAVLNLK